MLTLIDDTEPRWYSKYMETKRENGAATYSRELVKYHVPIWEKRDDLDILISTCPLLSYTGNLPETADLVVQYLHEYPAGNPLAHVEHVRTQLSTKYRHIVFVTAYYSLHRIMKKAGIDSLFLPMTIDGEEVRKFRDTKATQDDKKVLYFGNLTEPRNTAYNRIKTAFEKAGWTVDLLSSNRLNGYPIDVKNRWEIVASYKYGIGTGRSALEMMALGLKVVIVNNAFGGIITNQIEFENHLLSNFGAGVTTFSRKEHVCVSAIDDSEIFTSDIHDALPAISAAIEQYLEHI